VKTTTTDVRTAVARLESIPATPSFARIAVSAAKKAESSDHVSHVMDSKYHARLRAAFVALPVGQKLCSSADGP
jgi:hypothetical protein